MIDPGLEGRVALVTGANHGIGAAVAAGLAAQGCAVGIAYLRDVPPERYPEECRRAHARAGEEVAAAIPRSVAVEQDLGDVDALPRLVDQVEEALGPVEILVNNADHCRSDTFVPGDSTVSAKTLDRHYEVNARAPALLMAEIARRASERGASWGRVVNISTDASAGAPDEVSYWATKHMLESLSRSAALELASLGITVNTVCPGPTQTGWISPELEQRILWSIPMGRLGEPEDIADVVVFLCSEQARWLTGQTIYAGGGHRTS